MVPGEVRLTIDLRHVVERELDILQERFERLLVEVGESFGVTVSQERIWPRRWSSSPPSVSPPWSGRLAYGNCLTAA